VLTTPHRKNLKHVTNTQRPQNRTEKILHNKELYVLYSLQNVIWVIKSRRLKWAGHVARMGRVDVHTGF
jgi:hypothetical protein